MKRQTIAFTTVLAATLAIGSRGTASVGTRSTHERQPSIDTACERYLVEPRDAISIAFRWDQRLSFAMCRESVVVAPIERGDVRALPGMVVQLEDAFAPSIEIFRDVMSLGPPEFKILGAYGLGTTYMAIAVRARAVIEPDDERSRHALEPLLAPDLRAAFAAFDEVGYLAADYPNAAGANSIVKLAIANARAMRDQMRP